MKKENTYIMNLEGAYIYKDIVEDKSISIKDRDLSKLFSATVPYSLETIRADEFFTDTFYAVRKKQYTKKIINVVFDENYRVWNKTEKDGVIKNRPKIKKNKKGIRAYLYVNGFFMDGIKYVLYKRGAGKAKNGYALFIDESMKKDLVLRSRLGLEFEEGEECDLTSLFAYESLITSGLIDTIEINPKTEMFIIDDIYGVEFDSLASVTREIDGNLETKNEMIKIQNCLTDGQGLMDESMFKRMDKEDKGFALLRNDMLKNCAYNTKLQKFLIKMCPSDILYDDWQLKDMFGNLYYAKDIKLIITPNSAKFLKFAYKIGTDKECYNHYINNIDSTFGIVKYDKEGNYGNYNRTTYQLLNSIPNLSEDELRDIATEEIEYVMSLKNDIAVFRNYLGCDAKASLELEGILDDIEEYHDDSDESTSNELEAYETADLMNMLMLINSDVQYTKKFKRLKSDLIGYYVKKLRQGKMRLKDSKYTTLFANPYEMLMATVGKYEDSSISYGREVYCPYYKDGQEFCLSRNPHINSGNVMYGKNVYRDEYKWFNLTDNVSVINVFDNDAPDRLQGADYDSDQFQMIVHPILIEKAKYCEAKFTTPINKVKGSSVPRKNTLLELAKLDVILSDNYIGKIVNMSQIINSYLNHAIANKESQEIIDELYHASSRLSSMSQIEIDKSKKVFDNISMGKELKRLSKIEYIKYVEEEDMRGNMVNKMVIPSFFYNITDATEYKVLDRFNTPMDILQDVMKLKNAKYQNGNKNLDFGKILIANSRRVDGKYEVKTAKSIAEIIQVCGKKINGLRISTCTLNDKAKKTIERREKNRAIELISNKKVSEATILTILKQAFGKKEDDKLELKKYAMLTLNILFQSKKVKTLNCFKSKDMSKDEVLIESDSGEINIFGKNFDKRLRENIQ